MEEQRRFLNPADCPQNLRITVTLTRGAAPLVDHEMDVIVFVKRFASDNELAQDLRINLDSNH